MRESGCLLPLFSSFTYLGFSTLSTKELSNFQISRQNWSRLLLEEKTLKDDDDDDEFKEEISTKR